MLNLHTSLRWAVVLTLAIAGVMVFITNDTQAQAAIELQSVGALEFGPDGVLFIGDSYGAQVVALETNDTEAPANAEAPVLVESIDVELAAMLGTTPREIVINDMAVNPLSQNVYMTVHVGRSINPGVALVRYVKNTGEMEILNLGDFETSSVNIPSAPAFEDQLQYGHSQRILTVTDLTFYDGDLLIAGVSNEEFASTLRRVSYPFTDDMAVSSIEIFHGAHNQQETHAPIVTSQVYEIEGEPYLIAAYTCTPLAKIRLGDLQDGEHVMGTTMAELGFGNAPVDMFIFDNPEMMGGGERMLITNDQRSATMVSPGLFAEAELTEGSFFPAGLDQIDMPLTGALHADPLNPAFLLTIRRNVQTGDLNMNTIAMGLFFDAAESIVEYNWPEIEDSPAVSPNPVDYGFEAE